MFLVVIVISFEQADAKSETHSGNFPALQPLLPKHFVDERACSSQKQQQQRDLQTYLNNSYQLFDLMMREQAMKRLQNQKMSLRHR